MTRCASGLIALAVASLLSCSTETREAPARADIILVTIDTLRADAPSYAGGRASTPFLDRVAAEGALFTNAHAHNVVTLPSHANILTGLLPWQHGVRDNGSFVLDEKVETVAEMLRREGWTTGAFVGGFPLDARFGLDQGFDVYDAPDSGGSEFEPAERPAGEVLSRALSWYRSAEGKPRFLWIHLYDPHFPYRPLEPHATEYAEQPYFGEVAATDAALATHLAPVIDGAFLVVTSDHGEALGDHGELRHGLFAYEETLRVPLIVRETGRVKPGREADAVRHIDLVPTILERAGITAASSLPGRSIFERGVARETYFEALTASLTRGWAPLIGMIDGSEKYIDVPLPEIYDLASDPGESKNLLDDRRRSVVRIREKLRAAAPATAPTPSAPGAEASAKLLSLGYISGTAAAKQEYGPSDDPKRLVDLDTKMHRVVELYQSGRLDEAARVAREIVEARPDMEVGREMLEFVERETATHSGTLAALRRSVARGEASPAQQVKLGRLLIGAGQPREAIEVLGPIAASGDLAARNAYGVALAEAGRIREAIAELDAILRADPRQAEALQNLGVIAAKQGDLGRAEELLDQALAIDPRLPVALTTLGALTASRGDAGAAVILWKRAVALDATQYDALYNLAIVSARLGRHQEARDAAERFVETAPPARYASELVRARQLAGGL